jgi:type II secretory ATPase GspE/PulE/Tfp pilus assembly ATPase PilB-like protein
MGFGNIDDLLKQNKTAKSDDLGAAPVLVSGNKEVAEKFQKKMKEVGIKEREMEAMRFAAQIGYPQIDLDKFPVSLEALRQIDRETAERLGVVCFYATTEEIRLGALDPTIEEAQELLAQIEEDSHAHGALYVISEHSLEKVLKLYDTLPVVVPISKDIEISAEDLGSVQADVNDFQSLQEMLDRRSTTDILIIVLGAALKLQASDVHVEAEEEKVVVRIRLDGILHDAAYLPKENYQKLINRIKLTSSLKININDKPQDGRLTIKMPAGDVDVRVSTLPTVYGESVVMRLLYQGAQRLDLEKLGLRSENYDKLRKEIARPNGMIITTGPTGSGKTTTMYAIMQILNQPGVKIITLEDPVEYKMEGINQSQVDISRGYTFGKGLRSILRQDPDIAMVGEIRDLETAEIAIQAALTGHLILSTIHTNDASGAIARFLSMGAQPFLLAPALNCVIGQRLVRRICENCKQEIVLDAEQLSRVQEQIALLPEAEKEKIQQRELKFYQGKGCEICSKIGYKGQVGIHEIFVVTPEIEQMILTGSASEYDIERAAVAQGMTTMVQDGIIKALDGITSLAEVFRVTE